MVPQVALQSLENRWEACNLAKVEVICTMVVFMDIETREKKTWLTNSSRQKK